MTLTFAGVLDAEAVLGAVGAVGALVRAPEVADAWDRESVLPGMTVGGLTRHLVSQPECAVEFLGIEFPADRVQPLSLLAYADQLDWLDAPLDAPENTSISTDFNAMAAAGVAESIAVLEAASAALGPAIAAAGPTTFVPWQGCALATEDFLAVRLLEIVVHADDLASSVGLLTPDFSAAVTGPVVQLLGALALRRRHPMDVVRVLARAEREHGPTSAF
ncbi:maleylpyruvate isomerase N-terminal domain-containing protein [Pseudactinotalea suaedae]|uniref:maleylpyruvate isomerase N-terminal domain-containing protein n=1 Tax=Pseudactinotalea suaedae TaxID=1524924 RepID=UPI0012E1DB42|nr:maleylpyruvate isomerase N-terminal domain-containing protein [Pseudactinotalea suaedae]